MSVGPVECGTCDDRGCSRCLPSPDVLVRLRELAPGSRFQLDNFEPGVVIRRDDDAFGEMVLVRLPQRSADDRKRYRLPADEIVRLEREVRT